MRYIYITNRADEAVTVIQAGVLRIMLDLEILGKVERQGHKDMFLTTHKVGDIASLRAAIDETRNNENDHAELMVRINPLHNESAHEIETVIEAGADLIMLPMAQSALDVDKISKMIRGRVGLIPLIEHIDALNDLKNIAEVNGVSELYLGLNDLSLSLGLEFLFSPLGSGLVDEFAQIARHKGLPFGFGGIGAVGHGRLPAEKIAYEHERLNSSRVILSRAFQSAVVPEESAVARECAAIKSAIDALDLCLDQAGHRSDEQRLADFQDTARIIETIRADIAS